MKHLNHVDFNRLEVRNAVLQNLATAPSNPKKGQVYFDNAINKELSWDGTSWISRGSELTAADIKTLYESNADTNAFTDALLTKLSGIESGATADQTGAEIKAAYEGEANTNEFTDTEKTKLASLEGSKFLGLYLSLAALQSAHPAPASGSYADVEVAADDDIRYVWDDGDSQFREKHNAPALTAAQIKTQYEANGDTNALTDALLVLLNSASQKFSGNITGDGTAVSFPVTHALGTQDVQVQVYDNDTKEQVLVDNVRTNTTQTLIVFGEAPLNGKIYRVVVIG